MELKTFEHNKNQHYHIIFGNLRSFYCPFKLKTRIKTSFAICFAVFALVYTLFGTHSSITPFSSLEANTPMLLLKEKEVISH